ncbi:MAG: lamin tail domain-containing protein [Patescibacteria group bacterium]|nr:lamin tail domain-containing protein [Patescibacteria group bacterium]
MKKALSMLILFVMLAPNLQIQEAKAASALDIVINEIAWAGSLDASGDEYLELYNNTGSSIDLTGWQLLDDESPTELSGVVPANGYFLIEGSEDAVSTITADLILGLSFANSGDTLELQDDLGNTIDIVNSAGSDWPAGDNTTKASMERVSGALQGDDNFLSCQTGNGNQSSDGSSILGTPGTLNSVSESPTGTAVTLTPSAETLQVGETLLITASVTGVEDLFSYGFDLDYDETVLDYQTATVGGFLTDSTFNAELENGEEGTLVIGEARTLPEKTGISGDGTLFTVEFLVIGVAGSSTAITFSNSFISNPEIDIESNFNGTEVAIEADAGEITDLAAAESAERYSIDLTWTAAEGGADYYRILRLNQEGDYEELGTASGTTFTDGSQVIPNITYTYQIVTVLGISESTGVQVEAQETRGLTGDSNRSDRVDGRDLDNLAKHYGETSLDENYDLLIDTTYDGAINGSDLIDIGVNWALTYAE